MTITASTGSFRIIIAFRFMFPSLWISLFKPSRQQFFTKLRKRIFVPLLARHFRELNPEGRSAEEAAMR
jgi:hypothetical protein